MGQLPARIDRAALERIVQRAAELQTGEREVGEGLTEDEVLALGRDVGIPGHYLRQAMLEERSRGVALRPAGLLGRWVGPATVAAHRVARCDVATAERLLERWFEEEELLTLQRRQPGRISWEPIRSVQATLRRALGSTRRPYMLAKVTTVTATSTALEPGYTHVALEADLRPVRSGYIAGALAGGSVGLAGSAILLALGAWLPVALAPLALTVGLTWGISRQYPPVAHRAQLGLERALDQVEGGEVKPVHQIPLSRPGLVEQLAGEIRKALNPSPSKRGSDD